MTRHASRCTVLITLVALSAASPARAGVQVVFGSSWDGPFSSLQALVDSRYGPGRIEVANDYVGARTGDPDPFVWMSAIAPVLQVREVSGHGHRGDLGWYLEPEDGGPPALDGVDGGPVFVLPNVAPATVALPLPGKERRLGFYLRSADAGSGLGPRVFFTNRRFNDPGPGGAGPLHEPLEGGDVQALVYDVSRWTRPNTWLVCFEDRDAGAMPGPCCAGTDNDYDDFVFEVRAVGVTPALPTSFGALKILYR